VWPPFPTLAQWFSTKTGTVEGDHNQWCNMYQKYQIYQYDSICTVRFFKAESSAGHQATVRIAPTGQ